MSTQRRIDEDLKFIETCVELELLTDTSAEAVRRAVLEHQAMAAQEVLQRGLLTAVDVDIVHSLRHPLEVVPGYEILGLVGRGGMGVVYRAKQLDLDRVVALKTVLISNVSNPTAAARFEREAKTLARLQHPNIVQALNFGQHLGRYYFAMEYVVGRSCEQALRQEGRLLPAAVWSYVRQVASGLLHALRHRVIHRDIKPANLLLLPAPEGSLNHCGGNEVVKITDFGLAMFADDHPEQMRLTTGDKIMGSPAYMSPEQFGGHPVSFLADIYSLGATAWHLLFGSPPFQGNNIASLLSQKNLPINVDRETLPVPLPDPQWELLLRMLAPEAERRPASYEELIASIDRFGLHGISIASQLSMGPGSVAGPSAAFAISDQPTMDVILPTKQTDKHRSDSKIPPAERSTGNEPDGPARTPFSKTIEIRSPSRDATHAIDALGEPDHQNELAKHPEFKKKSRPHRSRPLAWAVAVLIPVTVGLAVYQSSGSRRGPRLYTRVIESAALFDGVTLSGWDVGGSMVGAWNTVESPDASTAIACTSRQGALTRRVDEKTHPRISLFVWPQAGFGTIDVDFAFAPNDVSDRRGSVRFTPQSILLGQKDDDFGELDRVSESELPATLQDRFHVLHLERQPTDWYVFLEQRLLGTIPIDQVGSGTAIRLVVHPASDPEAEIPLVYFTEMRLDNLAETTP